MADPGANAKHEQELVFLVRFKTHTQRNEFYATSGKEAGEAEDRARAMLRELVPSAEVAVAVWVVPRAKRASGTAERAGVEAEEAAAEPAGGAAGAGAGAGAGCVKLEPKAKGSSRRHDELNPRFLGAGSGLSGGSKALQVCLKLHVQLQQPNKGTAETLRVWQRRLGSKQAPPRWRSTAPAP